MKTFSNGRLLRPWLATLAAIHVAAPAVAGVGTWTSTGPYGGSNYTLNVYEAAPSTLYASGRGGMFRSGNSGATWDRIEVGLPDSLVVSSIASATNAPVLFLSSYSQLFRSGNAGLLWVPVSAPMPPDHYINSVSLQRASSTKLAIATTNGAYVSSNGGSTWTGPGASGTTAQFSKILYAADGSLYLGIDYADPANFGGASLLKSTDGGGTWTPLATQPPGLFGITLLAESAADPQRIYASDSNSIVTSANGGSSWTAVSLPSGGVGCGGIQSIAPHPSVALSLFVACRTNGVHLAANVTAPAWTDWTQANGLTVNGSDPVQAGTLAIHPDYPATANIWAGTVDGGLFSTVNGGGTWAAINFGYQSTNIRALATHPVDTSPSSAVVLAGYGDSFTTATAIYKSPNGGGIWLPSLSGLNAEQIRTLAIDPTTVDDSIGSENFTVYAGGRSERIPELLSKDGGIYKSTDAGNTWTTIDNGIAIVSGVRDMGTVRSIAPDPRSCTTPPPSGPCPIGSGPLQTILAAGSGRPDLSAPGLPYRSARIYKSTNAGGLWTASETGLPLPQDLGPPASFNYAYMGGIVPLVFDPGNPQTIYVGSFISWSGYDPLPGASEPTIANGVFKSTDGGATWVHSSNGLPRVASPTSSQYDVLALAINPTNPQILYAGVINFFAPTTIGRVYKSVDGGANWIEASTGIAGQDVRALFVDPMDPSGDTVFAGTGGNSANPGGIYATTNGGANWNSISIGLPADAALALTMPPRALGAPARIIAGTTAGVWEYTATPDEDFDGSPSAVENGVLAGDGNGDGTPDANQTSVASLSAPGSVINGQIHAPEGSFVQTTISIVPGAGACTQLNDSTTLQADLYPPDPIGTASSHTPWGLISFSLPNCAFAKVRVKFHGAAFDASWKWRNYGPRIPGDAASFGWYSFAGAKRIDAQTWELSIDATRQGNYRNDPDDILFIGGPSNLPDMIFDHGFE